MKILLMLCVCLLAACALNKPLRDDQVVTCDTLVSCSHSYYELHTKPRYEIGFVEYSERGNDFFPERTQQLLERLKGYSAEGDLAMVVFIHGWKHNAAPQDANVVSFTKALANLAQSGVLGKRKLVGIYVGWRGLSMHGLGSENLTYWDRKAVAEEVGRGGVTDLLTQLEQIDRKDRNYLVIVGHSFGGAITLSALHDQLLERLHNQQLGNKVRAFGDAVIMLNPAIEADQGLLLKENSLKVGVSGAQAQPLLYVISSENDSATHWFFPPGQWLGVNLSWSQVDLQRRYRGMPFVLREEALDTTALGNYSLFHTARIRDIEPAQATAAAKTLEDTKFGDWQLTSYCTPDGNNGGPQVQRMPCYSNEPVNFIYTSKSFISSHNDIFGDQVIAFLATAVGKAIYERTQGRDYLKACRGENGFQFAACFDYHYETARRTRQQLE